MQAARQEQIQCSASDATQYRDFRTRAADMQSKSASVVQVARSEPLECGEADAHLEAVLSPRQ